MPAVTLSVDTQLAGEVGQCGPSSTISTPNSLFDEVLPHPVATTGCPPIPGLFYDPLSLLPHDIADLVETSCLSTFFTLPGSNQVMLFSRAESADAALPTFLQKLLRAVTYETY